jgi:anti-sigma B factor antagonist/stage II sporulation protein AA (anti-sigma F factor antagonist)
MELQTQDIANVLVIHVGGRIDLTTAQSFQDLLLPKLSDCTGETKKALLDLSGVHYMSSAGLRVLVLASRQCQQQQGEIVLAALPPFLQKVFKITHFDALFKVYATVPAALEHLSPTAASLYSEAE